MTNSNSNLQSVVHIPHNFIWIIFLQLASDNIVWDCQKLWYSQYKFYLWFLKVLLGFCPCFRFVWDGIMWFPLKKPVYCLFWWLLSDCSVRAFPGTEVKLIHHCMSHGYISSLALNIGFVLLFTVKNSLLFSEMVISSSEVAQDKSWNTLGEISSEPSHMNTAGLSRSSVLCSCWN